MDYVVGSVAALISGNVTPNRPKLIRRALTPTKHQPSPNVTPKSEIEDRSIFLSPTLQKKKAVVKKSPKRIFLNPDSEFSDHSDHNSSPLSPKADKGKRHLKHKLETDGMAEKPPISPKSISKQLNLSSESEKSPKKKKKKQRQSMSENTENVKTENMDASNTEKISSSPDIEDGKGKYPKKKKQRHKYVVDPTLNEDQTKRENTDKSPNKLTNKSKDPKKIESKVNINEKEAVQEAQTENNQHIEKVNKKRKKKSKAQKNQVDTLNETSETKVTDSSDVNATATTESEKIISFKKRNRRKKKPLTKKMNDDQNESKVIEQKSNKDVNSKGTISKKKNRQEYVNPNAISNKESDSEHESDDEIASENEQINNDILNKEQPESSDDDEEKEKSKKEIERAQPDAEELKRTLFVGNVLFSHNCKKKIKEIFSKYGEIQSIRIRNVPVKDARVTPKLAIIKNELHPDISTVNMYIKYAEPPSVNKALVENNTVFKNHHLRVSRSDKSGLDHDPNCSVFVGNIPFGLQDEHFRTIFEKCGEIESVRIIRDKKTRAGKGFGYVNFASKDGVELALALSEEDLTIKTRILRVKRRTQHTNIQKGKLDFTKNNKMNQHKGTLKHRNHSGTNHGGNGDKQWQKKDGGDDGAFRRIMNKRQNQDNGDAPTNKRQKENTEKKAREEFVGMTSEKKKKKNIHRGQKKKKALSEILTK